MVVKVRPLAIFARLACFAVYPSEQLPSRFVDRSDGFALGQSLVPGHLQGPRYYFCQARKNKARSVGTATGNS